MVLSGNDSISGLTVGLLSTIITLLIDVVARIQKTEDSFATAAGLSKILSDETLGKSLRDIANSHEVIKKYNFPHYAKLTLDVIDECKSRLREIASGSVVVQAKTPQAYGMIGFQQAKKDIKVIHLGSMDFWKTDFGKKYFEQNRAARKHEVQITRIFVLTPDQAKENMDILKEHEKLGIRVVVINPDRLKYSFMIYDDRIVVDPDVDSSEEYKFERVVIDPTQVKKKVDEFELLVSRYGSTTKEILASPKQKSR
jgi:hypothetical protein